MRVAEKLLMRICGNVQKGEGLMNREEARKRATELVEKMTIEEIASQLRFDAPAIDRLGIPEYNWWNEGLHGVARAGVATMFPQAIGLGATFDEELMKDFDAKIRSAIEKHSITKEKHLQNIKDRFG